MTADGDPLTEGTVAGELVAVLADRGETVATGESLTAGLVAATIAGVPGASAVLRGGLVVYTTDLKELLAGVPGELLGRVGAVAPETARALADGARTRCRATWGIGLTGVAGPASQEGKPVGTVYVGVAGPDGVRSVEEFLSGPRWSIRRGAAVRALDAIFTSVSGRIGQ